MRASFLLVITLVACTTSPVASPPQESSPPSTAPTAGTSTPNPTVRDVVRSPPTLGECRGDVAEVESVVYRTIDAVDPDLVSLDIHSTATASSCPVVIWVHGGSWQLGDKVTTATRVKADHFLAAGYVFVSVNYRLVDDANDVRWPDFGTDVAAATAWVIDNADTIGVDPDRVALIGHSAGAHLVSVVTTNPDLLAAVGHERDDVACVVSLDSVTHDLTQQPTFERDIIRTAFGDDAAVLADGSPTIQATEHAADGPLPSFLIVTRGRDVRLQSAASLEAALLEVGASASVYDASPYDHRDVNVRLGEPGESNITPVVADFLADCLS